jgi:hypothetical protein
MSNHLADQALSRIDLREPMWKTLVVIASAETDLARDLVWRTWARIEDWPSVSPLVVSARWNKGQPWRVGSVFTQEIDLGFPLGRRESHEHVVSIEPGLAAEWGSAERGTRMIHMWRFEPLEPSGARITSIEVLHGSLIGVMKPLIAKRLRRHFQAQLDGLINLAEESA